MEKKASNCDYCAYYAYNEYLECYECTVNMDEDEYARYLKSDVSYCPYYRNGDEYAVVRKQI